MKKWTVVLLAGWILWGVFKQMPMNRGWYPTEKACTVAGKTMNSDTWAKIMMTWETYPPSPAAAQMALWDAEYECHPDTVDLWKKQAPPH